MMMKPSTKDVEKEEGARIPYDGATTAALDYLVLGFFSLLTVVLLFAV